MRSRRSVVLPPAFGVLLVAVAGCSTGTAMIDTDKAEKLITKAVAEQVGVKVKSVTCPKHRKAKKGDTFTCEVVGRDGTKGVATIIQKNDKGGIRATAPFVHTGVLQTKLAANLTKQLGVGPVTVGCPQIVAGKAGGTFECGVTHGKDSGRVRITETDTQGNVTFKLLNGLGG